MSNSPYDACPKCGARKARTSSLCWDCRYGSAVRRFRERYVEATDGCWLWTGATTTGYGVFRVDGQQVFVHRWAYEQFVGPIPDGLQIDHLCRTRGCVNPDHLEPVTQRENLLRGDTLPAANAVKTHCPQGHPYKGKNLRIHTIRLPSGRVRVGRVCRRCDRERAKAKRARI